MKFRLYREHGAQNSGPVFDAFEQGLKSQGLATSQSPNATPVIWSVLWHGRMLANRSIYNSTLTSKKPIVIIEVGNLRRGITWRISINHVNQQGVFGNYSNLDHDRYRKLEVSLSPVNNNRKSSILIAAQHQHSLQWQGMPAMSQWAADTVKDIRRYTDRPLIIRPHPRCTFSLVSPNVKVITPQLLPNTYDDFNIDYKVHCVVNHNSGPGVQAAIQGTPVVVDSTSLASPVSAALTNIESAQLPGRSEWFTRLCHTEWTREEIAQGEPIKRLMPCLESLTS